MMYIHVKIFLNTLLITLVLMFFREFLYCSKTVRYLNPGLLLLILSLLQ
ncbi:hypothetical protein QWZ13_10340 [Reinekea marina]|nr:hypothetical protein [Reinekea marina]MDN3649312.1 hypothetical protein [Reinekea marina]